MKYWGNLAYTVRIMEYVTDAEIRAGEVGKMSASILKHIPPTLLHQHSKRGYHG
jgi:hypothetical protein